MSRPNPPSAPGASSTAACSPTAAPAGDGAELLGMTDDAAWRDLVAELPLHDMPASDIGALRARIHQEFELSHAGAAEQVRRRNLGHFGRLAETAFVASVCVIQIVWLLQVVLRH